VEVLVVVAVIALLIAILLPALQAARESARRVHCANNVRQLALGCQSHIASQGHFPANGWGHMWTGEPDRGFGMEQPGGWIYNILPWLEQQTIRDLGAGLTGAAKQEAIFRQRTSVVPTLYCPSRRAPAALFATETPFNGTVPFHQFNGPQVAAKTDYAGNNGWFAGNWRGPDTRFAEGPECLANPQTCHYWAREETQVSLRALFPTSSPGAHGGAVIGVIGSSRRRVGSSWVVNGPRSGLTPVHVSDGLSNTLLVGEKYVNPDLYASQSEADNSTCFQGNDWDINRWSSRTFPPLQDTRGVNAIQNFGSAHLSSFYAAACDGSVHAVNYSIDPTVWELIGHRADRRALSWER
jgi:hypothetical protein